MIEIKKNRRRFLAISAGLMVPSGFGLIAFSTKTQAQSIACPEGYEADGDLCIKCPSDKVLSTEGQCIRAANCPDGSYFSEKEKVCLAKPVCPERKFFSQYTETCLSGGGCFLTTTCCKAIGLEDNCFELTVLRRFRDTYLAKQPGGLELIELYYQHAPQIAKRLEAEQDRKKLCALYTHGILPCVLLAYLGMNRYAKRHYIRCMVNLMQIYT